MLGDVLVDDVVVELGGVLLVEVILDLSSMRLNHVALSRRRAVGQRVVLPLDVVLHDLLVLELGVFVFDEALGGARVLLHIHGLVVEDNSVRFNHYMSLSFLQVLLSLHFSHQLVKLVL